MLQFTRKHLKFQHLANRLEILGTHQRLDKIGNTKSEAGKGTPQNA